MPAITNYFHNLIVITGSSIDLVFDPGNIASSSNKEKFNHSLKNTLPPIFFTLRKYKKNNFRINFSIIGLSHGLSRL